MATTDTEVQNLIVNKLTLSKYKELKTAGTLSETESYEITDIDTAIDAKTLPSQSGQSGKYLTTDGTNASWATVSGSGGTWGSITGTLSDQTDLNNALSSKANVGLDNLNSDGQMIIDSANGTISNCILEIPQNIKLTLENNVLTLKAGSVVTISGSTYTTVSVASDVSRTISTANVKLLITTRMNLSSLSLSPINSVGSGSSLPSDGSTYTLFFNTTDKDIYIWNGTSWVLQSSKPSYPLCVVDVDSNGVVSFAKDSNGRDMIFNGAGFIGHHAFVYPNVKALVCHGYKKDRTLDSLLFNNQSLQIIELRNPSYATNWYYPIQLNAGGGISRNAYRSIETKDKLLQQGAVIQYVKSDNTCYLWDETSYGTQNWCPFVDYNYDGTTVTDFTIRQPYEGARYLLTDEIKEQVEQNTSDIANKQDTITGAATSITDNNLTANRALTSDANGKVDVATTTTTELNYVHGVTSTIQTQLDAKASTALDNLSSGGQMIIDSANGTISNCILEIPQNLKLTLENNVLTLKAGSVITNSGLTYQTVTTTQNYTSNISSSLADNKYLVFVRISDFAMPIFNINKCCSGATDSIEAGDHHIWFDTNTKEVKQVFADSTYAQRSYPICLIKMKSGIASFAKDSNGNDMIFNGAGFVGHHAFVYPNVKALLPSGINVDGSLASKSIRTQSLQIIELGTDSNRSLCFAGAESITNTRFLSVKNTSELTQMFIYQYCEETNSVWLWNNNTWNSNKGRLQFITYIYNGTTVTDFTIRQPVRTATVEMLDKKANNSDVVHLTGAENIAGDKTFTNNVSIKKVTPTLSLQDTSLTKGTLPSNITRNTFALADIDNKSLAGLFTRVGDDGHTYSSLVAFKNSASENVNAQLGIRYNVDGTVYTNCPQPNAWSASNEIATTNYVNQRFTNHNNAIRVYQPTLSHDTFGTFIVIIFPNDYKILIDCGYINEEESIDEFLTKINVTHFDCVIITHFHLDHSGCAEHIIDNYCDASTLFYKCMDCDYTQFNPQETDSAEYEQKYKNALAAKGYTYTIPVENSPIHVANDLVTLRFYNTNTNYLNSCYHPTFTDFVDSNTKTTSNNISLCCLITGFGSSIFITGDLEWQGQYNITNILPSGVDLLQIPHHAVNRNGYYRFFDRLNPRYAFYTKNNIIAEKAQRFWFRYQRETGKNIPTYTNYNTVQNLMYLQLCNSVAQYVYATMISDDYNITASYFPTTILPSIYDVTHDAAKYISWTIEDVVNMLQYTNKLGKITVRKSNAPTTTLVSELDSIYSDTTGWIITPYVDRIKIESLADMTKAPMFAKSVTSHT